MALTQMQIIKSLGESLSWFQKEVRWGVAASELSHLTGRIGELYTALMTNGRMADRAHQPGYDVVSKEGERISVKTTTMSGNAGHLSFNMNTLGHVDRVVILRINSEESDETQDIEIENLLDVPIAEAMELMSVEYDGRRNIPLSRLHRKRKPRNEIKTAVEVTFNGVTIRELETGTIEVQRGDISISPVKPVLRKLAQELNVGLLNEQGNAFNTRQLGTQIIKSIREMGNSHS